MQINVTLAILVYFAIPCTSAAISLMAPIQSLYGAYEIVGRAADALGAPYRGWTRLAVEGGVIEVDRYFGGIHTNSLGRQVTLKTDDMMAIEFAFTHEETSFKAISTIYPALPATPIPSSNRASKCLG